MDDFAYRLGRQTLFHLERKTERLVWWHNQLVSHNPQTQIKNYNVIINQNIYKLFKSYKILFDRKSAHLAELKARIETLSPISILQRGYSITRTMPDLKVVRSPKKVAINQDLKVTVANGSLTCRVKEKSENGPKNI